MCGIGTADSLCAKAELRDLNLKLLCGSGTAERQVSVHFLCGSWTSETPSIIPEAELQTLKYNTLKSIISHTNLLTLHNILCAEAELQNLKSQYIPSAEAELRYRVT